MRHELMALTAGAALAALAGCGAPGLPPAGPAPGDVDVGYGTQPAEDVTGAVTSVAGSAVSETRPLKIEELLRGRVAGLEITPRSDGQGFRLRLRGTNSLLAEVEPLIILDGMHISTGELSNALAGLTASDIRQVDVLKDVASTSIYGMRGAGGVILIATRR